MTDVRTALKLENEDLRQALTEANQLYSDVEAMNLRLTEKLQEAQHLYNEREAENLRLTKSIEYMAVEIKELTETVTQDGIAFRNMLEANRQLIAENTQLREDLTKCLHALDEEMPQ